MRRNGRSPCRRARGFTSDGWAADPIAKRAGVGLVARVGDVEIDFSVGYGGMRRDVAVALGADELAPSGFGLVIDASALPPGRHDVQLGVIGADGAIYALRERIEVVVGAGAAPEPIRDELTDRKNRARRTSTTARRKTATSKGSASTEPPASATRRTAASTSSIQKSTDHASNVARSSRRRRNDIARDRLLRTATDVTR